MSFINLFNTLFLCNIKQHILRQQTHKGNYWLHFFAQHFLQLFNRDINNSHKQPNVYSLRKVMFVAQTK